MTQRDWFEILKGQLDGEPVSPTLTPAEVESMIAGIVSGRVQAPAQRRRTGSSRRWIAGGAVIVVLAGGATAAALWNRTKPAHPQQGIACHASSQLIGDAQLIPAAADPLGACAQLWLDGVLPDLEKVGPKTKVAPPQIACIGPDGELDVFPDLSDPPTTCADLGLADADTNLTKDPLVQLQDRLTNEINLACVDTATAQQIVHAALAQTGLDTWTVMVRDNTTGCVFAIEVLETKSVVLITNPTQTTTT